MKKWPTEKAEAPRLVEEPEPVPAFVAHLRAVAQLLHDSKPSGSSCSRPLPQHRLT